MTKTTLFIGDTHLQFNLMESFIKTVIEQENIEQIVFMGDYLDQWSCDENGDLYIHELQLLINFKQEMNKQNIDVIFLVGNHDVPYLTFHYEHYSCKQTNYLNKIRLLLEQLQPQIAFKVTDNIIASHAGYTADVDIKENHFEPWQIDLIDEYDDLQNQVGQSRGGYYIQGSVLWADLDDVISSDLNLTQIVGHTPIKTIDTTKNVIGVDTFSITSKYNEIGDGSVLVYKDNNFKVIKNKTWQSSETGLERLVYFS